MRMRAHMDVRPLARRMQEGRRRADAQAVFDRALGVGDTLLDRAVVVGVAGDAERHRARHEGLAQRIPPVHGGDGERAVPAAIADLRPGVEILALAAIENMAVDRGRAAEGLAARRVDAAAAGVGTYLL